MECRFECVLVSWKTLICLWNEEGLLRGHCSAEIMIILLKKCRGAPEPSILIALWRYTYWCRRSSFIKLWIVKWSLSSQIHARGLKLGIYAGYTFFLLFSHLKSVAFHLGWKVDCVPSITICPSFYSLYHHCRLRNQNVCRVPRKYQAHRHRCTGFYAW